MRGDGNARHVPEWVRLVVGSALAWAAACSGDIQDPRGTQRNGILQVSDGAAGCWLGGGAGTASCALPPVDMQPTTCVGDACACVAGLSACGGVCVDLTSDANSCGSCGNACPQGTACLGGQCACPDGLSACNGVCTITASDLLNCGGCGIACVAGEICDVGQCVSAESTTCVALCGGGRQCVEGTCSCAVGQLDCDGTCANTQADPMHCGGCGQACSVGETCVSGACVCPAGQTSCDGTCVDVQTSLNHCGGCGQPCFETESCTAGACRGATGADGCSGAARMISLTELSVYQSVKIPIMQSGMPVAGASRVTDVVTGRDTLFRVFVKPEAGFVARELSARLTLITGAEEDQYFAKQTVSGTSSDAVTGSTFMIFVPPDKITAETRYAVELVECGADPGAGNMVAPRFPSSGDAALEARDTGVLKVAIVPVQANSMLPDTSDAALQVYRDYFMAMYPISAIELTVTSAITTSSPINWNNLLEQIRQKRQSDAPAGDVYYYGFVKPAARFSDYCRSGCTAGVGYVTSTSQSGARVAVGLAFGDQASAATMAHEIGHNHGRNHAPCAPGGQISGVDSSYPHSGARLGSWGFDNRTRVLIDPDDGTDIMGYCNMKWVSDYTYDALINRVAAIDTSFDVVGTPVLRSSFRVLLLDADGPRWSFPITEPSEAFGEPIPIDLLAADGSIAQQLTAYRTEIGDSHGSYIVLIPDVPMSGVAVRVPGWPAAPM